MFGVVVGCPAGVLEAVVGVLVRAAARLDDAVEGDERLHHDRAHRRSSLLCSRLLPAAAQLNRVALGASEPSIGSLVPEDATSTANAPADPAPPRPGSVAEAAKLPVNASARPQRPCPDSWARGRCAGGLPMPQCSWQGPQFDLNSWRCRHPPERDRLVAGPLEQCHDGHLPGRVRAAIGRAPAWGRRGGRMSQLMVDFIITLDGYASGEGWPGCWGLEGPEYLTWLEEAPERNDTLLMGANTYRLMSGFAAEDAEGVELLNEVPKVVFSSTLEEPLSWPNTRLVRGDALEAVRAMKRDEASRCALWAASACAGHCSPPGWWIASASWSSRSSPGHRSGADLRQVPRRRPGHGRAPDLRRQAAAAGVHPEGARRSTRRREHWPVTAPPSGACGWAVIRPDRSGVADAPTITDLDPRPVGDLELPVSYGLADISQVKLSHARAASRCSTNRIWCPRPGWSRCRVGRPGGSAELVDQFLTVPTDKGANAGLKVTSLVAGMVAGADSIDDMAILRHGGMRRVFDACYAPSTLGSFLRTFRFGHVRQLDAVASRFRDRAGASRDTAAAGSSTMATRWPTWTTRSSRSTATPSRAPGSATPRCAG